MKVNEIFKGIQGESSFTGLPTTFIRLTGCNLRCSYCDTSYAFYEGKEMEIENIIMEVIKLDSPKSGQRFVEITGGEPLLQGEVYPLTKELLDLGYTVLLETNGSLDIEGLDSRVIRIMDLKTPGSGMSDKMDFKNIENLKVRDEVKFVISNRKDYEWSKEILKEYRLLPCIILFSTVHGILDPGILSKWILQDALSVRLNFQLHKYLWGEKEFRILSSVFKVNTTK